MATNQTNQPMDAGAVYGVTPLSGRRLHPFPKPGVFADLEEIASYNYVNPVNPVRRPSPQVADPTRVPVTQLQGQQNQSMAQTRKSMPGSQGLQSMTPGAAEMRRQIRWRRLPRPHSPRPSPGTACNI